MTNCAPDTRTAKRDARRAKTVLRAVAAPVTAMTAAVTVVQYNRDILFIQSDYKRISRFLTSAFSKRYKLKAKSYKLLK